ncbi:hypothetical protein OK074_7841 [Actinobacteria bacterium OK074]|nr:hypothetical protein OK074_7841 [Actinobacteria bacterium OK074]
MPNRIPPPGSGRTLVQSAVQSAGVALVCLQYVLALVLLPQGPGHPGGAQDRPPRSHRVLGYLRRVLTRTDPAPVRAHANTPPSSLGWGVSAPPLPGTVRTVRATLAAEAVR